jgi:competence protein ComEC
MAYPSVQEVQPAEKHSITTLLWRFRLAAEERLYRLLPWREASLLDGILLGNERNIPLDMANAFRNTGTSHVIAISGFNIAIISALFVRLFSKLFPNRKQVFWVTVSAVSLYTLLVGAQPPVVRAAIMGTAGLLGSLIGRRQTGMNSLIFTAAVMAGITPAMLWDASFQLSFFATMGLVLLAEPLSNWFERLVEKHIPRLQHSIFSKAVSEYILFTLAAQLATLPVLAFHFHQFPLAGLLANPLILPVQPLVMILGGLMVIFSLAWFPLGQVFAWLSWPPTVYTIKIVSWLSDLGGQPVSLQAFSPLGIIAFYALIFMLVFRVKLPAVWQKTILPSTALLLAALLTISIWKPALTRLDNRLHIIIPEQGDGQAVLLLDGKGTSWLIAGGKASSSAMQDLTQWQTAPSSRLTGLVWTSDGIDRKSISSLVYRMPGTILTLDDVLATTNGTNLFSRSLDWGADWQGLDAPAHITLQNGADIFVAGACKDSCASLIRYGSFEMLIPSENDPASLAGWLDDLQAFPEVILLSVEETSASAWLNTPAPATVLFITPGYVTQDGSINLLSLAGSGWVDIASDGSQMWVSTQHQIGD